MNHVTVPTQKYCPIILIIKEFQRKLWQRDMNSQKIFKSFTTAPKTRRHIDGRLGWKVCVEFMKFLWNKHLRVKARYETLCEEFEEFRGCVDRRTVVKYLGRPQQVLRYSRSSMVRMNRQTGSIAQFDYQHTKRLSRKKGALERFGFIQPIGDDYYKLHHESFNYYYIQKPLEDSLEAVYPSFPLPTPEGKEGIHEGVSVVSKDDLCVYPIEAGERNEVGGTGGAAIEAKALGDRARKKEEEEGIESTHTYFYGIDDKTTLTPEEDRILEAAKKS